ncbi:MAG: DMT family transporter [Gammaproteobacteria bacterium]|nr:DMT family transporter [Gammaproteobacteria bacterium]
MAPIHLAQLVLLAALWGASFLFMRVATPEFGPVALIAIRVTIAALFLLPVWWLREGRKRASVWQSQWPHLLVVGALNSAIPFVLFAYSTLSITGGLASILNSTAPLWAALVAYLWLREPLSSGRVAGMVLGLGGVAILVSDTTGGAVTGAPQGIAAALAATLLYGIAANYTVQKLRSVSSLTIATFSLVAATILLALPVLFFIPTDAISKQAWLAVLAMGLLSTGVANILYFHLIASVGATRAITVTFLIPIFGTLFGAVFLQEPVTTGIIIGTIVILFGTALVTGVLKLPVTERAGD